MADISQIKLIDGTIYTIKDPVSRSSVAELEQALYTKIYGSGTILYASSENPINLNDVTDLGRYQCGQSASTYVSNKPVSTAYGFALTVATNGLASRLRQTVYLNSDTYAGTFFERYYTSNGWTAWYKFSGEIMNQ